MRQRNGRIETIYLKRQTIRTLRDRTNGSAVPGKLGTIHRLPSKQDIHNRRHRMPLCDDDNKSTNWKNVTNEAVTIFENDFEVQEASKDDHVRNAPRPIPPKLTWNVVQSEFSF